MAENINIPLGDGQNFQAPLWATQATLEAVLSAVDKMAGTTDEQKKAFSQAAKSASKGESADDKLNKAISESNDHQRETTKAIKESSGRLKEYGGAVVNLAKGIITGFLSLGLGFFKLAHEMGRDTAGRDSGLALDMGMNAVNFANSIQMLGISYDDLTKKLENSAASIAIMGRENYSAMTREIINITHAGTDFAKSLAEITDILDEDLKIQQQAGVLHRIDQGKSAKMSRELYAKQLKDQLLLGKSIGAMRDAANDPIQDLSVQMNAARMGGASGDFIKSIQEMAGEMAASGVTQGLINVLGHASNEFIAFSTKSGNQLFDALSVLDGTQNSDLRGYIKSIQQAKPADVPDMLRALPGVLRDSLEGQTDEQREAFRIMTEGADNPILDELVKSMFQMSQIQNDPNKGEFNKLAISAAIFDTSVERFGGMFKGTTRNIVGAFATPLTALMQGFTEDLGAKFDDEGMHDPTSGAMNVFQTFSVALLKISAAFTDLFGKVGEGTGKFKDLTTSIRTKLNPIIETWTNNLVEWIKSFNGAKIETYIDNMVQGFTFAWNATLALGVALKWLADKIMSYDQVQQQGTVQTTDKDGKLRTKIVDGEEVKDMGVYDTDGNAVMEEEFNIGKSIMKALALAFGAQAVVFAASALFAGSITFGLGKLFAAKAVASGGAMAVTGAGAFAGAAGLAAFGLAATGVGVAAAGLAYGMKTIGEMDFWSMAQGFIVLGAALALAAAPIFLVGASSFTAAPGLSVLALAMAAVGVAAAGIGAAAAGISMLFDTPEEEMAKQDRTTDNLIRLGDVSEDSLNSTALGIEAIADAMSAFGDATNDGWFSGPDISDMDQILDIMVKFSELSGNGIIAFTGGLDKLIASIEKLNKVDINSLNARAESLAHLNNVTQKSTGTRILDTIDNAFNGSRKESAINMNDIKAADITEDKPWEIDAKNDPNSALLQQIVINTKKTSTKIAELIENT